MKHTPSRLFGIALLTLTLTAASVLTTTVMTSGGRAAGASSPTPDPRLILHPHTVSVRGSISRHDMLTLRLYPAIPGKQQIAVRLPPRVRPHAVALHVIMSGMPMPAIHGRLTPYGLTYRGALTLPMFGAYLVTVTVPGYRPVVLRVLLPLPGM